MENSKLLTILVEVDEGHKSHIKAYNEIELLINQTFINLIDGDITTWKFEDEDIMKDILDKIKKQLLTIEII